MGSIIETRMIPQPQAISSVSEQAWRTPDWLYRLLDQRFAFALDAAASSDNAKHENYYDEQSDGLTQPWCHTTFCNPPWANPEPWVAKACAEAQDDGTRSVLLLPQLGITTNWYRKHRHCARTEIISPRIAYDGTKTSPPGGSMLMVFGDGGEGSLVFWDVMRFRP